MDASQSSKLSPITLLNTIMSAISCLLTDQENRLIKDFMEPTQQSLATTVAQLVLTSPLSRHKEWITSAIGVVCFIKDRQVRSHFIKVRYSLANHFRKKIIKLFGGLTILTFQIILVLRYDKKDLHLGTGNLS